jgi:hypothetical protein
MIILSREGRTMPACNLLLMVLGLFLGMVVAAPAVTIQTPISYEHKEANLYQIITAWGFPVDNDALQQATPLESLPPGAYSLNTYAGYSNTSQYLGTYSLEATAPDRHGQPPAGSLSLHISRKSGNWDADITFSESSDFGFFDDIKKTTTLLTTQNQNSTLNPYRQSSGLIFDLGEIDPQYAGRYIIAFENGRRHNPYKDLAYNDLVMQVARVPLPGTLPLVAGGLLGLWMIGRRTHPAGTWLA